MSSGYSVTRLASSTAPAVIIRLAWALMAFSNRFRASNALPIDLPEHVFLFQKPQTFADDFTSRVVLATLDFGVHEFFRFRR